MARFFGKVGYADPQESPINSGIWIDVVTEYSYFGDVTQNARRLDTVADKLAKDISVSTSISIVVDQYAIEHFFKIIYVEWSGVLWTVTDVEVKSPRLILRLGSVYNGPTPTTP